MSAIKQSITGTGNIVLGANTLTVAGTASISGTHAGTSSGTNTGDQTSVSGNAGTATALQTTRTIGGSNFDGTGNVTSFPSPGAIGGTTPAAGTFTTINGLTITATTGTLTIGSLAPVEFQQQIQTIGTFYSGGNVYISDALTTAGDVIFSGAYDATFTLTGATSVTFPTTGTLATTTGNVATATALATARNIFNISFNGTANVAGDATNTGHFASIPGTGAAGHFVTQNGTAPTLIAGRSAWYSDGSGVPSFKNGTGTAVTLVRSSDIGVSVQAYDADLTTWAGITPAANVGTFLATPSGANLASALTSALPVTKGGTGVTTSGTTSQIAVGGGTGSPIVWTTATGTGAPVRATGASLVTPNIGVATATSINNVSILASSACDLALDGNSFYLHDGNLDMYVTQGSLAMNLGGFIFDVSNVSLSVDLNVNGTDNLELTTVGDTHLTLPITGTLAARITATATLDFPSTAAGAKSDLTMTLTGAVNGEAICLGVPNGSIVANGVFTAWVSAANTVTVRFTNTNLATALDPASGTFTATIVR